MKQEVPPFPPCLQIDVHNYCNAKCSYCPYESLVRGGGYRQGFMDWDLFQKIVDDCSQNRGKIRELRLSSLGESLAVGDRIKPYLAAILDKGLPLYFTSNMSHFDAAMQDWLDGRGWRGRVHAHVMPDMGIDYDNQKLNYESALKRWGPDRVVLTYLTTFHEWAAEKTYGKHLATRCEINLPHTQMIVCFDGRVQLCCQDVRQQVVVGDVVKHSIAEVWTGEGFRSARDRIAAGRMELCSHCEWGVV